MADVFSDYAPALAWDEMFAAPGQVRAPYSALLDVVNTLGVDELTTREDALARVFLDRGVTFALGGEERPFPLDVLPRLVSAAEWAQVEQGVKQRVRAFLDQFAHGSFGLLRYVGLVGKGKLATVINTS